MKLFILHHKVLAIIAVLLLMGGIGTAVSAKHRKATGNTAVATITTSTVATRTSTSKATPRPKPAKPAKPKRRPKSAPTRQPSSGLFSLPDFRLTPGAADSRVTQANIHQTICVSGYTETVRPPESVTEPEKLTSMAAYGDTGSPSNYEYDHLISLELGGAPNDSRNLWPEPRASPNPKDRLESHLHAEVCDGVIGLATAQHEIATDWVTAWHQWKDNTPATPPLPITTPTTTTTTTPQALTTTPNPVTSSSNWHAGEFRSVSKEALYEQAGFHCVLDGSRHRLEG